MRKRHNTLGLVGVIAMGILLFLFIFADVVMLLCNRMALYGGATSISFGVGFINAYAVLYYFLVDFFPILLIGNMFVVYNSFCKSYNVKHLLASTVFGFLSVFAYAIGFIPVSMLDMPSIARGADTADSVGFFGWFKITVLVLMLTVVFTCWVQIAFMLYFSKVRKRINYTRIMHRYENFRFVMLGVFVLYLAMFVCYVII